MQKIKLIHLVLEIHMINAEQMHQRARRRDEPRRATALTPGMMSPGSVDAAGASGWGVGCAVQRGEWQVAVHMDTGIWVLAGLTQPLQPVVQEVCFNHPLSLVASIQENFLVLLSPLWLGYERKCFYGEEIHELKCCSLSISLLRNITHPHDTTEVRQEGKGQYKLKKKKSWVLFLKLKHKITF